MTLHGPQELQGCRLQGCKNLVGSRFSGDPAAAGQSEASTHRR
jgi:hypothetical protein